MKMVTNIVVLITVRLASVAYAQTSEPVAPMNPYGFGFGGPVAGHVDHASTVAESYGRGAAAVIQAQGQYNYLTSLAARNAVETQKRAIENHKFRVETLNDMRAAYKARTAAEYRAQRAHVVAANLPAAAPSAKLNWPAELAGADLAGYRRLVERLVGQWVAGLALSDSDRSRLDEATSLVIKKLEQTSAADATVARQFLASVFAPATLNIASR